MATLQLLLEENFVDTDFFRAELSKIFEFKLLAEEHNLVCVLFSDPVRINLVLALVMSLVLNLVLDDSLCHGAALLSFFTIEEFTEDPSEVLDLGRCQIFPLDEVVYDRHLLACDRQEEVAQRIVVVQHVSEQDCLALVQTLEELGRFLDELENCLIVFVLITSLFVADQVLSVDDHVSVVVSPVLIVPLLDKVVLGSPRLLHYFLPWDQPDS